MQVGDKKIGDVDMDADTFVFYTTIFICFCHKNDHFCLFAGLVASPEFILYLPDIYVLMEYFVAKIQK